MTNSWVVCLLKPKLRIHTHCGALVRASREVSDLSLLRIVLTDRHSRRIAGKGAYGRPSSGRSQPLPQHCKSSNRDASFPSSWRIREPHGGAQNRLCKEGPARRRQMRRSAVKAVTANHLGWSAYSASTERSACSVLGQGCSPLTVARDPGLLSGAAQLRTVKPRASRNQPRPPW
jgi:hypothetical protein